MKRYRISGEGCPIGRLTTSYKDRFTRVVEAETIEAARLRAYETHEHIPGGADNVRAVELGEDEQ